MNLEQAIGTLRDDLASFTEAERNEAAAVLRDSARLAEAQIRGEDVASELPHVAARAANLGAARLGRVQVQLRELFTGAVDWAIDRALS